MIIGEKNLIIGKIFTVVSNFSMSINLFNNLKNYILKSYKIIVHIIKEQNKSPPVF